MTFEHLAPCAFGPFRLDPAEHRLLRGGAIVPLTPKIFAVLCVLVRNHGHLVTKEQLLNEVWPDAVVEEANLNRAISVLRKALGERTDDQRYIETVPRVGYRFIAPVTVLLPVDATGADARGTSAMRHGMAVAVFALIAAIVMSGVVWLWPRRADVDSLPPSREPVHRQLTFGGHEGLPTVSLDGHWLAYVSSTTASQQRVMIKRVDGGEPREMFTAAGAGFLRWSPTREELLFWARTDEWEGLYIIDVNAPAPRRIARNIYVGTWSPDGNTLAIADFLGRRIHFANRDGRRERDIRLEGSHAWFSDLDWSQEGWLLVASNDDQGRYAILTIRAEGHSQQLVHAERTEIVNTRWASGGARIFFTRRVNQVVNLMTLPMTGGSPRDHAAPVPVLTGFEMDRSFGITADGRYVAYARSPFHSNLWTVAVPDAGQPPRTLQLTTGTAMKERPSVSPDGRSILFTTGRDATANLFVMSVGGGAARAITDNTALNIGGVWSPDGAQVAFASNDGGASRIWIAGAAGERPRPLPAEAISNTHDLSWSPGGQILYQREGNRDYVQVTQHRGVTRGLVKDPGVGWVFSPVQSPGGRIAVAWNRRDGRGVWLIDRDGAERLLYTSVADSTMPIGWSRTGEEIFVVEGKAARYRGPLAPRGETLTNARILAIAVDGGRTRVVTALPFEEIGGVSMTPDGRHFVCAVYSSESDVWLVALG